MTCRPRSRAVNEPTKTWVQFGRAAGEIDGRHVGRFQDAQAMLHRFARHRFSTVRPGVNVAMFAGLITEFSDIDLKDVDAERRQGGESGFGESGLEIGKAGQAREDFALALVGASGCPWPSRLNAIDEPPRRSGSGSKPKTQFRWRIHDA